MSNFSTLAERNRAFADRGEHTEITSVLPRVPVFVVTCLDPRTDPAGFLGVGPGDAPVVRNAGGRVTDKVINDVALIVSLAAELGAGGPDGPALEVAVIHHTQCGTGFLADPQFRSTFAARSGIDEGVLAAEAVIDPEATVRIDVARLVASPRVPDTVTVSGHVYDLDTGLVTTIIDAVASGSMNGIPA
jgi:carbonic anhydrase